MASNVQKGVLAAALLMAAAGYGYHRYSTFIPASINNGVTGEGGPPRGAEDRRQMEQEFARAASLTPEQQKQIQELRESGDRRDMREKMEKILTPEQRTKMREAFTQRMAQRDQKMKQALSPSEYERYREKREERMRQRGGRGGPGGGQGSGASSQGGRGA